MSETPITCPKCGAARIASDYQGAFECGTMIDSGKQYHHTGTCKDFADLRKPLDAERDQLLQKVQRLEEDKDMLTRANSQVRRIAMERDEAERRVGELEASNDNLTSKATAWKMYADRLEEAGSALRTAAAVFRLKEIEDIYDRFVLMEDLLKDTSILYDDPPTSGDHIALSEAMHNWSTSLSSSKRKAVLSVIQQAGIEIK